MCIDRLDHIVNGRKALTHTDGYVELHRTTSWLGVWNWLALELSEYGFNDAEILKEFQRHGEKYSMAEIKSANAKCHIMDWANYYGYTEKDGEIVIFGED